MAHDCFSLDAAAARRAQQRDHIEVTRPAIALDRLRSNAAGRVLYALKIPYRDGTAHVVFERLGFMVHRVSSGHS